MKSRWIGNLTATLIGIAVAFLPALIAGGCERSLNGMVGDVTGVVVVATAGESLSR